MKHHAPFQSNGKWLKRVGRYGLGIIGVLVIYIGLDVLFSLIVADATVLGFALRYLRYATVTFWVTFIAPWIFIKIGLADRQDEVYEKPRLQPIDEEREGDFWCD